MGKMSSCGYLLDLVFVFDCKRSLVSADVESRSAVIVVGPLVARPYGRATVMKIWPRPHDSFLSFAQRPQRASLESLGTRLYLCLLLGRWSERFLIPTSLPHSDFASPFRLHFPMHSDFTSPFRLHSPIPTSLPHSDFASPFRLHFLMHSDFTSPFRLHFPIPTSLPHSDFTSPFRLHFPIPTSLPHSDFTSPFRLHFPIPTSLPHSDFVSPF